MKKNLSILIVLMGILLGCSNNSDVNADELQEVTVMLDYTPNTNHTGIYVADKLGYYAEQGLKIKILEPGEGEVIPLVANGKIDFAISYEDTLASAVDKGIDIKSLATITNHSMVGAISRQDRNLADPSKWKGATYCGWGTPIEEAYIKEMARQNGVDPQTMKFTTSAQTFLASSNECDIFWGYEAWENAQATNDGIAYDYTPALEIADYYPAIIITSSNLIEQDNELVTKFMQATKKGYEYAAVNAQEAADIFMEANPEYDKTLIETSQKIISPMYVNDNQEFGYMDETVWTDFTNFMIDSGIISETSKTAINQAYTNKFLKGE
ncbi:MAG: ABC transporter substrate-binding protein [Mycoplasmatales bacterium]